MKKKMIALLMMMAIVLSMAACVQKGDAENGGEPNEAGVTSEEVAVSEEADKPQKPEKVSLSLAEFEALQAEQPLAVVETNYLVQDEQYKSLYPDMLQAIVQNNTGLDIKDAVVAFVGWDVNNLPVKLKGSIDFSGGSYVKLVNFADINLVPGATFGKSNGFEIDSALDVTTFKAIVISFESFDGEKWENPYVDVFTATFEGKKYAEDMVFEATIVEPALFGGSQTTDSTGADEPAAGGETAEEVLANIAAQPLRVIDVKYTVQDEKYKSLYPDMLQAILQNDTELDIKDAVVAFVAWDTNGLPVKLKGSIDFSDGSYVKQVSFSDINLIPGAKYGEDGGFEIDDSLDVSTFKAIVMSYESFDGQTWDNPLFGDFCKLYEGKKLAQ